MWRLNVKREYIQRVFEMNKFFINNKYNFELNEPLLLQLLKQDEPMGRIGRVRGILFFGSLIEDKLDESLRLYGIKWKYIILPINGKIIKFHLNDAFNFENVIGDDAAKRYYGQAEAVRFSEEDEEKVRKKIIKYLNL
ncbi:MAG: hypothetical protein QW372_01640 [Nitrososphaerales archaeon]